MSLSTSGAHEHVHCEAAPDLVGQRDAVGSTLRSLGPPPPSVVTLRLPAGDAEPSAVTRRLPAGDMNGVLQQI